MTAKEIATRIGAHLHRFEADPEINKVNKEYGTRHYYVAGAWAASPGWIGVRYVSYQGSTNLCKREAEKYLAWLDAGNVGTHYAAGVHGTHHS